MFVTILGGGTGIPHPERSAPGFVIRIENDTILLDPGPGSLQRMEKLGLGFRMIDYVVFSHYHPDHSADLAPLLFALCIDPGSQQQLCLIGPPGLRRYIEGLTHLYGAWVDGIRDRLSVREVVQWSNPFDSWRMQSVPMVHSEISLGYRWTDSKDRSFAYSGDTDYCSGLVRLAKNADLALIEASTPHPFKMKGHLSGVLAGRAAAEAEVGHLVVNHRYPLWDDYDALEEVRQGGFEGKADLASDGMNIDLD